MDGLGLLYHATSSGDADRAGRCIVRLDVAHSVHVRFGNCCVHTGLDFEANDHRRSADEHRDQDRDCGFGRIGDHVHHVDTGRSATNGGKDMISKWLSILAAAAAITSSPSCCQAMAGIRRRALLCPKNDANEWPTPSTLIRTSDKALRVARKATDADLCRELGGKTIDGVCQ
jgi:hypothetical protein